MCLGGVIVDNYFSCKENPNVRRMQNNNNNNNKFMNTEIVTILRCHPCWHYLTLASGSMDMVDYGCLNLIPLECGSQESVIDAHQLEYNHLIMITTSSGIYRVPLF